MVYDFASRLIMLRKKRGWSQQDVAQRIGKSDSAIGTYENDTAMPSLEAAAALADVFGVSLDYLLEGEKSRTVSVKGLTDAQACLLTELAQEFAAPTGHGPMMSASQERLLSRVVAEFVKSK